MFKLLLKRAVPIPRIEEFNSFLFIGPHPDDIEIAAAPTVAKLTAAGKRVDFLIATDGCMGSSDERLYGRRLAEIRKEEALASSRLLGANSVTFLDFTDGGRYPVEALSEAIAREIVRIKPEVVFGPDPDVISETHADHIKTGVALKYAMNMCPYPALMETIGVKESFAPSALAFFYTDRPNAYVSVGKFFSARRRAALCHRSQFDEKTIDELGVYFKLRAVRFGLRRLTRMCDGFRVYAPIHLHCFPEASEW
ncbi:MAG: PIG-L family deacetylase [Ruminococcaceae bacterium]|nr:PIG-L family deacetylase [Oscillospiraceae bacterium]